MSWNIDLPPTELIQLGDPNMDGFIREVMDQKYIAYDTETTGLDIVRDRVLFASMAFGNRRVCFPADVLPLLKPAFSDPGKVWWLANAKYDTHMNYNMGVAIEGHLVDTQTMHALLYEERSHKLKDIADHILGWRWTDFNDTFGRKGKKDDLSVEEAIMRLWHNDRAKFLEYAANDAWGTKGAGEALRKELEAEQAWSAHPECYSTLWDLFWKTEVPFTKVLWKCERNGCRLDLEYLDSLKGPMEKRVIELDREIVRLAGKLLNPGSDDDVARYLFEDLKLAPIKMTSGGQSGKRKPSVDKEVLAAYSYIPEVKLILERRVLQKLVSTYLKNLINGVDAYDRIHTRYNQDVARTGRLSSSNPNLQNVPNPEKDSFFLRKAFIAKPGYTLVVADYSQLEMRLLAAAAGEQDMIDIFRRNWDIHMGNAVMVFGDQLGITYDDVVWAKGLDKAIKEGTVTKSSVSDSDSRKMHVCLGARLRAKNVGFGLNYGMKKNTLAGNIGCSIQEAEELIERYMARYPAVRHFYDETIDFATTVGSAYTYLGRRRYLPNLAHRNALLRWKAQRQAVNVVIQGTAAEVAKMGMLFADGEDLEKTYDCKMLLQIHDELVFECPTEHVKQVIPIIKRCMENPFPKPMAVPLVVDIGSGHNWCEAK